MNNEVIWQKRLKKLIFFVLILTLILSASAVLKDKINNYKIFYYSFYNLIHHLNIYSLTSNSGLDYFKYSPTFALLMAPLSILPMSIGAVVWSFLNVGVLIYAVRRTSLDFRAQFFTLLIILPELIGTTQNFQSNALIVALMLLGFLALEKDHYLRAAIYIALATHIKFFAVLFLLMALLYKKPFRFILSTLVFTVTLALLPMLVVGYNQLDYLYHEWGLLLKRDANDPHRISVFGVIQNLFGVYLKPTPYQFVVGIILAIPFGLSFLQRCLGAKAQQLKENDRLYYFCVLLLWMIVFNHMSESPTYIIGILGFALWYTWLIDFQSKRWILFGVLCFASLFYSDLVPKWFKAEWVDVYVFKVWPFLFIYIYAQVQLYKKQLDSFVYELKHK